MKCIQEISVKFVKVMGCRTDNLILHFILFVAQNFVEVLASTTIFLKTSNEVWFIFSICRLILFHVGIPIIP